MKRRLEGWLSSRFAPLVIIALALGLAAPALTVGFAADDHLHRLVSRDDPGIDGLRARPLDLFVFASGDRADNQRLIDSGVFPWWTDPDVKLAFMRPVASLTHALDHRLWPDSAPLHQAHGLLWFALALAMVWAFYRRFVDVRWLAALALLLYAIDDARGPAVGWIANRNALIALALAIPVMLLHDRWRREGWRPGRWLAPAMLGVALLAGEAALAIGAYLAAYALHLDRAGWRSRLASLLPYLGVVIVWRLVYDALGYGVVGSGVYIDPGAHPIEFAAAAVVRFPLLLLGQLGGVWSDLASLYPLMGDDATTVMVTVAVGFLALLGFVLSPLLRADRVSRFFATGMVLAAVPICSTFPADRLLAFVGLGGMGLIARLLGAAACERAALGAGRGRRAVAIAIAAVLALVHLIAAPPLLALRSRGMVAVSEIIDRSNRTIPADPAIRDKTVVLANVPGDPFGGFIQMIRQSRGTPRPAHLRWLAGGLTAVSLERLDRHTLRVAPEGGFLGNQIDRMLRSTHRPFRSGDRIEMTGLTIEIERVTPDGRPASVRARFDVPLEDPSLVWLRWRGLGLVPYAPPAVGQRDVLEAIDILRLLSDEPSREAAR